MAAPDDDVYEGDFYEGDLVASEPVHRPAIDKGIGIGVGAAPPPPTPCSPNDGCGTGESSPPTPAPNAPVGGGSNPVQDTCHGEGQLCFGAVGMGCAGAASLINGGYSCDESSCLIDTNLGCDARGCYIDAGSILHDECCERHPDGHWCAGPLSGLLPIGHCVDEWNRAREGVLNGFTWRRVVRQYERNCSGRVDRAAYCAPPNTVVPSLDRSFCCGGQSRAYRSTDSDLALSSGVYPGVLTSGLALVVCTGALPEPPLSPPPKPGLVVPPDAL